MDNFKKLKYYNFLDQLFNDPTKFVILNEDPTLQNLSPIQRYLNILELRGEIRKDENKQMMLKFVQIGRAHGLPKTHKQFLRVPSFRSVIDTTNRPHQRTSLQSQQISSKSSQSSNTDGRYSQRSI